MRDLTAYQGYLLPVMNGIVRRHLSGQSPREISDEINASAHVYCRLPSWSLGINHAASIKYALRRIGYLEEQNRLALSEKYKNELKQFAFHASEINRARGRVIDMGGRRDHTFVWTPEMQATEFSTTA